MKPTGLSTPTAKSDTVRHFLDLSTNDSYTIYWTGSGTACWPCRQRKVKCDNKQPCENCVKRDHANLCSYNPKQNANKSSGGSIAGGKRGRSPASENSSRKGDDRWPRTTGRRELYIYQLLWFSEVISRYYKHFAFAFLYHCFILIYVICLSFV